MNDFGLQNGDRRTVLVVDDSVQNLQLLTALLKDDYRIKVAKNGAKAVEITVNDPTIDLILMDVIMPEMDGYEACRHIKANDSTAHIPVIFLTALTDVSDETKGFEVGGADFMSKPFNTEIVKARIKTHIELQHERKKADLLLAYLLPDAVIQELKTTGSYAPVIHQNTSIMFCDLVDFTTIASKLDPTELVSELTDLFTQFDGIVTDNNGFRVKTLGDGYMATTGISNSKDEDHATDLVNAGLQIIEYLKERNATETLKWECRIGIHSGSIISGVVGNARCQFDIMGDNVNIASRVESNGQPMQVTITPATAGLLTKDALVLTSLGKRDLKGKGEMELINASRK